VVGTLTCIALEDGNVEGAIGDCLGPGSRRGLASTRREEPVHHGACVFSCVRRLSLIVPPSLLFCRFFSYRTSSESLLFLRVHLHPRRPPPPPSFNVPQDLFPKLQHTLFFHVSFIIFSFCAFPPPSSPRLPSSQSFIPSPFLFLRSHRPKTMNCQ
jgi:hypothetical protein